MAKDKGDKNSPDKPENDGQPRPLEFSETDKKKARAWFRKAEDSRQKREYDYAIESYITGLEFWPEAVEAGHMPLRALGLQRAQAGGKKPGMMEGLKRPTIGKDAKKAMLNAEYMLAKDPGNSTYVDALVKNANKGEYHQTLKWVAPLAFDSLKKDKKPDKGRFKAFRAAMIESSQRADEQGDAATEVALLEVAAESLEFLLVRFPGEEDLRIEQRDVSGKLAIAKGKYDEADDFRESLRDAEQQKILHDSDRTKQADDAIDNLIEAARKAWEEKPTSPSLINAYVEALLRREEKSYEDQAIEVLMEAAKASHSYAHKKRADDIRLRQLERQRRRLVAQAKASGKEEDLQQARLARMEQVQTQSEIFRERVEKYPTDMRLRYELGRALFEAGDYDEAIPMLQEAQTEPRSRTACQLLIGRSFMEKGAPAQAVEVLKELLESSELLDEMQKGVLYWLGRAYEADNRTDEAKATYGRLLRMDYNYANGDARKRMENLK